MAQGVRVLGKEEKISKHFFLLWIHIFALNQPPKEETKAPFDFSPKVVKKIKENLLTEEIHR